jgi:hypothetical protein
MQPVTDLRYATPEAVPVAPSHAGEEAAGLRPEPLAGLGIGIPPVRGPGAQPKSTRRHPIFLPRGPPPLLGTGAIAGGLVPARVGQPGRGVQGLTDPRPRGPRPGSATCPGAVVPWGEPRVRPAPGTTPPRRSRQSQQDKSLRPHHLAASGRPRAPAGGKAGRHQPARVGPKRLRPQSGRRRGPPRSGESRRFKFRNDFGHLAVAAGCDDLEWLLVVQRRNWLVQPHGHVLGLYNSD